MIHKALQTAIVEPGLAMRRIEQGAALSVIHTAAGIVQGLPWEGAAGAKISITRLRIFLYLTKRVRMSEDSEIKRDFKRFKLSSGSLSMFFLSDLICFRRWSTTASQGCVEVAPRSVSHRLRPGRSPYHG